MAYLQSLHSRVNTPSPESPRAIVLVTAGGSVSIPFVHSLDDSEDGWSIIGEHVRNGYVLSYDFATGDAVLTAPADELEAIR